MPGPYPLASLAPTITAAGITAPSFIDILASLQAAYQNIYGTDVDLASDTQDGQWVAIQAQVIYDVNQAVAAAYLSYSPTYAQGVGLSSVVKINGIRRLIPSYGTADLQLVGVVGTIINNGVVADLNGNLWNLPATVAIPNSGTVTVTARCQVSGDVAAPANTIITIQTIIPGWQTATNPLAATPGFPLESDATLRKRQTFSTSIIAITPRISILGALANLPGVGRVQVYDNDTNLYDPAGIPPHSIAVVIEGGDDTVIATTILEKKNTGCGSYGDTQILVIDGGGVPQMINFWRLVEVPIWVTITLTPLQGYLNSYGTMVINAVSAFINALQIGEDIYVGRLYAPADLAGDVAVAATLTPQASLDQISSTYVVRSILIGTNAAPSTSADIAIAFNRAPSGAPARVTIVLQ
jgi:uncharacterized phage protein gp47/JayE